MQRKRKPTYSDVKGLIQKNKLKEAINELLSFAEIYNAELQNELIIHSSNLQKLKKDRRIGIVEYQQSIRIENALKYNLLELADEINDEINKQYKRNPNQTYFQIEIDKPFAEINREQIENAINIFSFTSGIERDKIKLKHISEGSIRILCTSRFNLNIPQILNKRQGLMDEFYQQFRIKEIRDVVYQPDEFYNLENAALRASINLYMNRSINWDVANQKFRLFDTWEIEKDIYTYCILMNKSRSLEEARRLFTIAKEKELKLNDTIFSVLISKTDSFNESISLYDELKELNIYPSKFILSSLIRKSPSIDLSIDILSEETVKKLNQDELNWIYYDMIKGAKSYRDAKPIFELIEKSTEVNK